MRSFENDSPQPLDCGCTAYCEDDFMISSLLVKNIKTGELEKIIIKHCDEPECLGIALAEKLDSKNYMSTYACHVYSEAEKQENYELSKGEW